MNSGSCSQNVVIMKMAFCLNKFSSSLYFHRYYLPFLYSCCATLPGLFLKGQRPCWRLTLVETLNISLNFETLFFFSFTKGHCLVWRKQQLSSICWHCTKTRCITNIHCSNASFINEVFHWQNFQHQVTCLTWHNDWDCCYWHGHSLGWSGWWWEWSRPSEAFVSFVECIATSSVSNKLYDAISIGFLSYAGDTTLVTPTKAFCCITCNVRTLTISTNFKTFTISTFTFHTFTVNGKHYNCRIPWAGRWRQPCCPTSAGVHDINCADRKDASDVLGKLFSLRNEWSCYAKGNDSIQFNLSKYVLVKSGDWNSCSKLEQQCFL